MLFHNLLCINVIQTVMLFENDLLTYNWLYETINAEKCNNHAFIEVNNHDKPLYKQETCFIIIII